MRLTSSLFIIVAMLCATPSSEAQPVKFSLEAGTGFSTFHYNEPLTVWDPGGRNSFNSGILAERPLSRYFGVQAGVRISLLRNKVQLIPDENLRVFEIDGSYSVAQTYISVPLLLTIRPIRGNTSLFVGPEASYIVAARMRVDQPEREDSERDEPDSIELDSNASILNSVNRPGMFLTFGVGQDLPIGTRQFTIKLAYSLGLTPNANREVWVSDWRPRDISFRVGYLL